MADIEKEIKSICSPVSGDITRIEVRRSAVLLDALKEMNKQKFKPFNSLKVESTYMVNEYQVLYL